MPPPVPRSVATYPGIMYKINAPISCTEGFMSSRSPRRDIHFTADEEFADLLERGASLASSSKASVVREAVVRYVREMERNAVRKQLEEAYEGLSALNLDLDREMAPADSDWPEGKKR